jgi:hypothetical protein
MIIILLLLINIYFWYNLYYNLLFFYHKLNNLLWTYIPREINIFIVLLQYFFVNEINNKDILFYQIYYCQ